MKQVNFQGRFGQGHLQRMISLVYGELECRKGISPAVDRRWVIDTLEVTAVAMPKGSRGPLAQKLGFPGVGTRRHSGIEARWSHTILDPVDHDFHVVLRIWAGLKIVDPAVGCARDQVKLIPILERVEALLWRQVTVHDGSNGLPVMY